LPLRTVVPTPVLRLLGTLVLALAAALSPAAATAQEGVLNPGDMVRVTVYRNPDMSGELVVGEDGTLLHPLYRDLRVTGLSQAQLNERMAAHLARYGAEPAFVAEPLVRVTVSGEVRQPQVTTVRPGTTVFQALAQAGGIAPAGRASRVLLVRGGESRTLDLTVPSGADATQPVRSGDLLVVERRSTWVRDVLTPAASVASVAIALINLLRR
jgi:polysaccharide export outer membrane protein